MGEPYRLGPDIALPSSTSSSTSYSSYSPTRLPSLSNFDLNSHPHLNLNLNPNFDYDFNSTTFSFLDYVRQIDNSFFNPKTTNVQTNQITKNVNLENQTRQKKEFLSFYFLMGQVLNQILREGFPLSQAFSSPLLIQFLLSGVSGVYESNLSQSEIIRGILDFDSGYKGEFENKTKQNKIK